MSITVYGYGGFGVCGRRSPIGASCFSSSGKANPRWEKLPFIMSSEIFPLNLAPIAVHSSDTESAVHKRTVAGIPFAPCEGESRVHEVLPSSFSEKLKTRGIFVPPKARSPRHAPSRAEAPGLKTAAIAAARSESRNDFLIIYMFLRLRVRNLYSTPLRGSVIFSEVSAVSHSAGLTVGKKVSASATSARISVISSMSAISMARR